MNMENIVYTDPLLTSSGRLAPTKCLDSDSGHATTHVNLRWYGIIEAEDRKERTAAFLFEYKERIVDMSRVFVNAQIPGQVQFLALCPAPGFSSVGSK